MRIIDINRGQNIWKNIAITTSSSSTWGFDSLKLFTTNPNVKIGLWSLNDLISDPNLRNPTYGIQKFHSGGGWTNDTSEHDFEFDLSSNPIDGLVYAFAKGIDDNSYFKNIWAYPTGNINTRGKNSSLYSWDFDITKTPSIHQGAGTSIYLQLQSNAGLRSINFGSEVYIKDIVLNDNNWFDFEELDRLLISINNSGESNGNLNYLNIGQVPTNVSRAAYDSLISKGWTITGTAPPTS